jgi:hypothetical protein
MANIGNYALYFIFVIYFLPLGSIFRLLKASRTDEKLPGIQGNKAIE